MFNSLKNELQNILSGKSEVRNGVVIQTAAGYLKESSRTSNVVKESKHYKKQETATLKKFISENKLWVDNIDLENYVSEGAEQKVYLKDDKTVQLIATARGENRLLNQTGYEYCSLDISDSKNVFTSGWFLKNSTLSISDDVILFLSFGQIYSKINLF